MASPAEKPTQHHPPDTYTLPSASALAKAGALLILDEHNISVPFESLYKDQPGRQLIIFIRHFFCGVSFPPHPAKHNHPLHQSAPPVHYPPPFQTADPPTKSCEEYVRALSASLPPSLLSTTTPPTTLTLIGCGQPSLIPAYRTRTMASLSTPYRIYCDPTLNLYKALSMVENLDQSGSPEYITKGSGSIVWSSVVNMFGSGTGAWKGGKVSQNGGEWSFEGGELRWCHRMRNTRDHVEVKELKEVLGLEGK